MGNNLVVYSGGADSTMLLDKWARVSSDSYPTIAISIDSHSVLGQGMLENQRLARNRYLKWAKKNGMHIEHISLEFGGNFDRLRQPEEGPSIQVTMWLSAIAPFINDGDTVLFGYIKQDCIWHYKYELKYAFDAICKLKGVNAKLQFPLEKERKYEVLDYLKENNVPDTHWWSCEMVGKGKRKPCGHCSKCREIEMANFERSLIEVSDGRGCIDRNI